MDKGKKIIEGQPRQLLADNLEMYVMEIYDMARENIDFLSILEQQSIRHEFFKNTLFAYSNRQENLAQIGEALQTNSYYIRQSNLEDLFLRVTGRSLNELQ